MKKLLYLVIAVFVLAVVYYALSSGQTNEEYESSVLEQWKKKEKYLRTNSGSPFVKAGKEMGELAYFPIDQKFHVTAKVERITNRQLTSIQNSNGTTERYLNYAWLHFKLDEKELKLLVLKPMFGFGFFLGFADDTSGDTSYGGGRYLDLMEIKGDRVTLDFNLSYNPYCAYSAEYLCPFPPRVNLLSTRIEAGEKDYLK